MESEKLLEKKLKTRVEALGGMAIKILSIHINGLPDRLCLLPGGRLFFTEIKTTKKKPTRIQLLMHRKIRKLGFEVYVIDKSEQIDKIFELFLI
jgi:CO dehydrogenase/acetyl-CoA synthase delta subunit